MNSPMGFSEKRPMQGMTSPFAQLRPGGGFGQPKPGMTSRPVGGTRPNPMAPPTTMPTRPSGPRPTSWGQPPGPGGAYNRGRGPISPGRAGGNMAGAQGIPVPQFGQSKRQWPTSQNRWF